MDKALKPLVIVNFFSWTISVFLDVGIVNTTKLLNCYINGRNRFVLSIKNQLHFTSFEPEWLAEHLNYVILLSIIPCWCLLNRWSMQCRRCNTRVRSCWRLRNMLPDATSIKPSVECRVDSVLLHFDFNKRSRLTRVTRR